jgi:hypothetical protein
MKIQRLPGLVALLSLFGCSIVTSPSESLTGTGHAIAGSFEAMSRSVSGSFEASTHLAPYARDLRSYVAAFARGGSDDPAAFERGVSRVAESHGVVHWEGEPVTFYAIGQGLRDANASEAEVAALFPDTPGGKLALDGWRDAGAGS